MGGDGPRPALSVASVAACATLCAAAAAAAAALALSTAHLRRRNASLRGRPEEPEAEGKAGGEGGTDDEGGTPPPRRSRTKKERKGSSSGGGGGDADLAAADRRSVGEEEEEEEEDASLRSYRVRPIGAVTSPYPQRAGCPRQGLLAPHSRSRLELHPRVPAEAVDGLDRYSHVWILFRFHLNPIPKGRDAEGRERRERERRERERNGGSEGEEERDDGGRTWPSKVRPPRAGGRKVGVLATRSPHRPNGMGMSAALLEGVEFRSYVDPRGRKRRRTIIKLLGLDLVDGTPVLDVKPYVPWDSVTAVTRDLKLDRTNVVTSAAEEEEEEEEGEDEARGRADDGGGGGGGAAADGAKIRALRKLRVPPWVARDDELGSVEWTPAARDGVRRARGRGELSPLYPPPAGDDDDDGDGGGDEEEDDEVCRAISEVVAQDPRSVHEGRGGSGGGEGTGAAAPYEITFMTLRVAFRVMPADRRGVSADAKDGGRVREDDTEEATAAAAATADGRRELVAAIVSAAPDMGDETAAPGSYQRGMAARRAAEAAEAAAAAAGRGAPGGTVRWARPVREGDAEGEVLELEGGGIWAPPRGAA